MLKCSFQKKIVFCVLIMVGLLIGDRQSPVIANNQIEELKSKIEAKKDEIKVQDNRINDLDHLWNIKEIDETKYLSLKAGYQIRLGELERELRELEISLKILIGTSSQTGLQDLTTFPETPSTPTEETPPIVTPTSNTKLPPVTPPVEQPVKPSSTFSVSGTQTSTTHPETTQTVIVCPPQGTSSEESLIDFIKEWLFLPLIAPIIVGIVLIWINRRRKREQVKSPEDLTMDELREALRIIGRFTGKRCVLLTDMKGSTELYSKMGNIAAVTIQQQRDLLIKEIGKIGGESWPVGGDGMLAFFTSSKKGIEATVNIQRRIEKEDFSIRAGLDVGEVFLDPNMQCQTIIIASRIMGLADGGQIFVSKRVYEDARAYMEISAINKGSHKLKGIDEEITIYEIPW